MGTNFYVVGEADAFGEQAHIGKRSAAGRYCWDCGVTLCKGGKANIHYGVGFYDECPMCGRQALEESLKRGAAGRELGFNTSPPQRKRGVQSAASFTWAMAPEKATDLTLIEDEYGRLYTRNEFFQVLEECPIQFFDSVGQEFS